jgi:hypothetical protein
MPNASQQFQLYVQSISGPQLFNSLEQSFATTDKKFHYIRDLNADNLYIHRTDVDHCIAARRTVSSSLVTKSSAAEHSRRWDPDGAVLFAKYVQRKVTTPASTPINLELSFAGSFGWRLWVSASSFSLASAPMPVPAPAPKPVVKPAVKRLNGKFTSAAG